MFVTIVSLSFPIIAVGAAAYAAKLKMRKSGNAKKAVMRNVLVFAVMVSLFAIFSVAASAAGTTDAATATAAADASAKGMGLLAAGLCTGLACGGAGIALGGVLPAAIGAVSEDPKALGKSLIFIAFGETIALYGFVMSFIIMAK